MELRIKSKKPVSTLLKISFRIISSVNFISEPETYNKESDSIVNPWFSSCEKLLINVLLYTSIYVEEILKRLLNPMFNLNNESKILIAFGKLFTIP